MRDSKKRDTSNWVALTFIRPITNRQSLELFKHCVDDRESDCPNAELEDAKIEATARAMQDTSRHRGLTYAASHTLNFSTSEKIADS